MTLRHALLAHLGLLAGLLVRGQAAGADLEPLVDWLRQYRRGRIELDVNAVNTVRRVVDGAMSDPTGAVEAGLDGTPNDTSAEVERSYALEVALLELSGLDLVARNRGPSATPSVHLPQVRAVGQAAFARLLDRNNGDDVVAWIGRTVLGDARQPTESRIAAAISLVGRHRVETLDSLLLAASNAKLPELVGAAQDALCGWPLESVTRYFASGVELGENGPGRVPVKTLARHLELLGENGFLDEPTAEPIRALVARAMGSENWREASRALELSRPLVGDAMYPVLLDALDVWAARRGGDSSSRRIENDIVAELERRSGRAIGNHPERWRHWWLLVQQGKIAPPTAPDDQAEISVASFFSLRPVTERVTFIIDRSGSMSARFTGDQTRSRYDMAIDQTLDFLGISGERTRFNVFLFSDDTLRYKPRLQTATERNLQALRRWLENNGPAGGTHLKEAVLEALELRRDGTIDLARLESDTIIVLCDGATIAGPGWVSATLEAVNDRARLVFHCVQIGDEGDGTLELLSKSTGGNFIRIR